jgi:pimeloyl-ACP methyl ester carboxylesterase
MRKESWWAGIEALAPTLAYDSEVMGDRSTGGAVPRDLLPGVTPDALVLVGEQSPAFMIDVGRHIADAMPHGRLRVLAGEEHVVAPEVLAPVLADFLSEG